VSTVGSYFNFSTGGEGILIIVQSLKNRRKIGITWHKVKSIRRFCSSFCIGFFWERPKMLECNAFRFRFSTNNWWSSKSETYLHRKFVSDLADWYLPVKINEINHISIYLTAFLLSYLFYSLIFERHYESHVQQCFNKSKEIFFLNNSDKSIFLFCNDRMFVLKLDQNALCSSTFGLSQNFGQAVGP